MWQSLRWKRHRTLVLAVVVGLAVLLLGFGNTRVAAITSSERHAPKAAINVNVRGRGALFDDSRVHTVAIRFEQADYDRLIAAYRKNGDKDFLEASIAIDGTTITPVGLRLKGNSTLRGLGGGGRGGGPGGPFGGNVSADNPDSLPWLISFDEYQKGQRYQGYKEIAIRPVLASKTMLNEALALRLIGKAGEPTERAAYAAFTVNGGAAALRLLVEIPGDNYVEQNFRDDGVLFKALSTGRFAYRGDDPLTYADSFKQITHKKQQDVKPLLTILQWVANADDAEFAARLDRYVDVDSLARYVALQDLLGNFDDMAGPGQNYYLWYDLKRGTFTVLTWDMNLALAQGGFRGGAPPGGGGGGGGGRGGNRLKERFLASPAFKDRAAQARAEVQQALYGNGTAAAELDRLAAVIATSNLIDPTILKSDIAALRAFIDARTAANAP